MPAALQTQGWGMPSTAMACSTAGRAQLAQQDMGAMEALLG